MIILNVCRSGWLTLFKKRRGICYKTVCGESKSVNLAIVQKWKTDVLNEALNTFSPENIFNADETALFYKLRPNKTMAFQDDPCFGRKQWLQ
jgi:hypothetical protein